MDLTAMKRSWPLLVMAAMTPLVGPVIAISGGVASATIGAQPGAVLVVAPWGAMGEARIAAAGGRIIGPVSAPMGWLAASQDPDFAARLRASGAWAVLDGRIIGALCGGRT